MLRTHRSVRRAAAIAAGVLTAALVPALIPSPAQAWAPADTARITPGVQMYTDGAQCTANFVYTDSADNVYVGYAAHCAGLGEATDTNGCAAKSLPLGTPVTFNEGGSLLSEGTVVGRGTLAYSSWLTMQKRGTTDPNTCAYNDLALVKVSSADKGKVNPSVPLWGGPTGIDTDGTAAGDRVYSYGNSSVRADLDLLSPKIGLSLGDSVNGTRWSHPLYNVTPGIPGDSGSGFLSADGKAVGTLSTLGLLPLPASNNIGDLDLELDFAKATSGISGLRLVNGTEPFKSIL
ncbi:hypothetical protein J2S40_002972 [Nocardioides luteus]|uniref:hypothetical protein n=1 Tax=Nocardioides luteus TaxID=1844 RepID=UPI001667BAA0|nr:hypothetical protein [Nocardioides luteus]MDR7311914.1 hypothetical protein [Nocardioides luteus]GGR67232.1 hypothetical protein GCM10010197_38480 [Nocardioides luteus]